jgi:hypothetical protein
VVIARVSVKRHGLAAVALCLLFVLPARAQEPPPSVSDTADRPGFADSPILLGRGHVQLESGLSWENANHGADRTRTFTFPQVELHAGFGSRLEVSFAWDGLVSSVGPSSGSNPGRRDTGWADVRLGVKLGLVNRPSVDAALIGYADLPVGSEGVSSGYADPLARFAWDISLSERVGLSGTADLGAARQVDGLVRAKPAASVSLGTTIVRALNGFLGIVVESPPVGVTPDVWSVEAGLTLPAGLRTQIDIWVSRRVAGGPDDWFIGAGFVRRLR